MALATHLVGRAPELGSVDRLLTQIGGGGSAALELVGEPGIGKTRLLAELAARADARAYLVLSGRAGELELDLPFWVFVDALDEYVHGLDPHRLESLDGDVRAELATVFPSAQEVCPIGHFVLYQALVYFNRLVRRLSEHLGFSSNRFLLSPLASPTSWAPLPAPFSPTQKASSGSNCLYHEEITGGKEITCRKFDLFGDPHQLG